MYVCMYVCMCVGLDLMEFASKLMMAKGGDAGHNSMKLQPFILELQDAFTALEKVRPV